MSWQATAPPRAPIRSRVAATAFHTGCGSTTSPRVRWHGPAASISSRPIQRFDFPGIAGGLNYRFHHTADYGTTTGTYRPLTTLQQDVAKLIGSVFLSEIAYAAPIFPTALTPPILPHDLVLNV